MLKTRLITALVLLSLLVPALFQFSQTAWAMLVAVIVGVGAWEWGGLLRWSPAARRMLGLAVGAGCALTAWFLPSVIGAAPLSGAVGGAVLFVYIAAAAFWLILMPLWLRARWMLGGGAAGLLVGLLLLFSTWLAMVQLRAIGPLVLLGVLAVVWIADSAAYFAGRAFGRRKLAPAISPGKTWEGAAGAVVGVLAYGFAVREMAGLSGGLSDLPAVAWAALLLLATAVSIIGDLFESLLKRQAGIKDSSQILPGHGGVLDRIDSLTSTLPFAALVYLLLAGGGF